MRVSKKIIRNMILESLEKALSKNKKLYSDLFLDISDKDILNKNDYDFGMSDQKTEDDLEIVKSFIRDFMQISDEFGRKSNISFVFIKMVKKPVIGEISQFFNRDKPAPKYHYKIRASSLRALLERITTSNLDLALEVTKYVISNYIECKASMIHRYTNEDVVEKIDSLLRKSQQSLKEENHSGMSSEESITSTDNQNLDEIAERFIQEILELKNKFPHGSGKTLGYSFIHMNKNPLNPPSEEVSRFLNKDKPVPKSFYRIKGSTLQRVFKILILENKKELAISIAKFLLNNYRDCKNSRPSDLLMTEAFEELKLLVDSYSKMYRS